MIKCQVLQVFVTTLQPGIEDADNASCRMSPKKTGKEAGTDVSAPLVDKLMIWTIALPTFVVQHPLQQAL